MHKNRSLICKQLYNKKLRILISFRWALTPALIDYTSLIARVLSRLSPLEDLKENRLLKAVAVIRKDLDTIISNNYRKKARIILVKLLSISLKVFFLCAIGTTLDNLRSKRVYAITTDIYANAVSNWRRVFLIMPLYDLLDFLKDKYTDALVQINCPFSECFLLSIKFRLAEWGIRIEFGLGIIKAVVEYGI
ncbi:hypothetical protein V2W45_1468995 [Cenococcum geophilum]